MTRLSRAASTTAVEIRAGEAKTRAVREYLEALDAGNPVHRATLDIFRQAILPPRGM
jgi:hypothetical protein